MLVTDFCLLCGGENPLIKTIIMFFPFMCMVSCSSQIAEMPFSAGGHIPFMCMVSRSSQIAEMRFQPGGFAPMSPYQGAAPGPRRGLKRPLDPGRNILETPPSKPIDPPLYTNQKQDGKA